MRIAVIALRTTSRSPAASSAHTLALLTSRMLFPPSDSGSVENDEQIHNGGCGQQRRHGTWFGRKLGTGDWNVDDLTGRNLNLAVSNLPRQIRQTHQFQGLTKKRMGRIGDLDDAFTYVCNQRCIAMVGFCPFPNCRPDSN
jgi:hypothetical protein